MTQYKYAFKTDKENVVKVVGRDIALSPKVSFEMCKFVKGMTTKKAAGILELVKEKKLAVPFTRATEGAGHKPGKYITSGKYPLRGATEFLKMIHQLEANATAKGLSTNLTIIHACGQRASEPFHYGRRRRVKSKRCHVELAATEIVAHKAKKQPVAKTAEQQHKATEHKSAEQHKKADSHSKDNHTNSPKVNN